ncbi:uncharacterized protein LOC134207057 [Armigeres subalbatus]|uniref:uncharacterized protein LOC134207057 n=1 Tax=Armigeres subalbatus TaxID=124917 RepID=UPI002ED640B6
MYTTLSDSHGMMSDEETFEYFLDCDMSKYVYEQTHKKNPARFPTYKVIQKMKAICSPPLDSIEKTATKIQVRIQSLMQHTVERIVKSLKHEINQYMDENNQDFVEMVLLSSWGMDGSTGYSQYHQSFPGTNQQDDSDVFSVTTTPIHLYLLSNRKHIFWYNLTPQSIRYCRPIMLEFVKESKQVVIDCKNTIKRELSELVPVKIDLEQEKYVLVDFDFVMSKVDGIEDSKGSVLEEKTAYTEKAL